MRIAVVGSRGIESSYSGIERILRELCPRLVGRGHSVDVFSESKGDRRASPAGVGIVRVPSLAGQYTETLTRSGLSTLIGLWRGYDVMSFWAQGPGLFSLVTKLGRCRSVVSVQGLDWQREKWPAAGRVALRAAEATAVRCADAITVASHGLERYFQERYRRQTVYIPNGTTVRPRACDAGPLAALGVEPQGYLLFAARLVPEKGCHELIAAFNRLDTDRKLVVAGTGRYQDGYVEELRGAADPRRVIFAGHVEGALLEALYAHAYLFVLPSHLEGQSLALLEAMGHGTAALVSDIPENREVVGDAGLSFRVGDVADLRRRLARLSTDRDLVSRAAAQALERVRLFDWERITDAYERVFSAAR